MSAILPFTHIEAHHLHTVGGKALTLATLMRQGIQVPDGLCITTTAYEAFIGTTGLATRIDMEINRLPLADMRWEEIWDMALRIRNLFLHTPIPPPLMERLSPEIEQRFGTHPVVVRSSSPEEDRAGTSFAGLHESYVNISGVPAILEHIRLVWASLWSDGALIYRKERGMDMQTSTMAVILQTLVPGQQSGVTFSLSPDGENHMVVESVYGLNQGLVDNTITPDRWTLDRQSGGILSHIPAVREEAIRPTPGGTQRKPLTEGEKKAPPLHAEMLDRVFHMAMALEKSYGRPQDLEWTIRDDTLFLLQSRPVTTIRESSKGEAPWSASDKRPWYLSLKRSFANLKTLHRRIEDEWLPQMASDAEALSRIDPTGLSDAHLIDAIEKRIHTHEHWLDIYWRHFIPFAHGVRLFGQIYNDIVKPEDPYAFIALLGETRMTGVERNREMQALAHMIRTDSHLEEALTSGSAHHHPQFENGLTRFLGHYDDLTFKAVRFFKDQKGLIRLLLEMARHEPPKTKPAHQTIAALTDEFIKRFPQERHGFAREVLDIGRASYQLRDNDNIALARIEAQLIRAVDEGRLRITALETTITQTLTAEEVVIMLSDPSAMPHREKKAAAIDEPVEYQGRPGIRPETQISVDNDFTMRARQIVGQPAGPGLAVGTARVITAVGDLFEFKAGEILVCDAIDPNMTFVVPLAAAIVERRGGMLVHGAIIAREYGLPCITGVADATALIHTGNRLTVDGYLGIVTIDT